MAKKIQSIKGFYDVPPQRQKLWRFMESKILSVLDQYNYQEIGLPILESTDLFTAGVGTHTDIVEKEMYSWTDPLNDDDLTLRPECTAGCVRAVIEGSLTYNGPIKLFYRGPMFRHENVQKGRQRQFHQVGVEAFGYDDASSDAEQILLLKRFWKSLNLENIELQLNTIGDPSDRELYRKILIEYFEKNKSILDDDAQRRLYENPLRILDSKNSKMQDMLNNAPKLKGEHFTSRRRITEIHAKNKVCSPSPTFNCVGPGAVGTGSLAGMRVLNLLKKQVNIWPFDNYKMLNKSVFVEIFPTYYFRLSSVKPDKNFGYTLENINKSLSFFNSQSLNKNQVIGGPDQDDADAIISSAALRYFSLQNNTWDTPNESKKEGWIFGI